MGMGIDCNPCCGAVIVSSQESSSSNSLNCPACIAVSRRWKVTISMLSFPTHPVTGNMSPPCSTPYILDEFILSPSVNVSTGEIIPCQWNSAELPHTVKQTGFIISCLPPGTVNIGHQRIRMSLLGNVAGLTSDASLSVYWYYQSGTAVPQLIETKFAGYRGTDKTLNCLTGGTLSREGLDPFTGTFKKYSVTVEPQT